LRNKAKFRFIFCSAKLNETKFRIFLFRETSEIFAKQARLSYRFVFREINKKAKIKNPTSKPPEMYENGKKTGGFTHVLANNSPKTPFFAQKYLTRCTHETFFEEYINFEAHYLSHCRVIPLQSFGSHIRPPAARIRVNRYNHSICALYSSLFCNPRDSPLLGSIG
jgi:hypothetical protein